MTLLTDFGHLDPYVGVMKGVLLGLAPDCHLVDLTHSVAPQDVRQGAFQLARAVPWFPPGSIHLAVVDPGVGGDRAALWVRTARAFFLAPDNGLLDLALQDDPALEARRLRVPASASATFHGRDVFAPAAGMLASGREPAWEAFPGLRPRLDWSGTQVLHIDHFGNLLTSVRDRRALSGVLWGERRIPLHPTYSAVAAGELLCLWGSDGHLEIAANGASAADRLAARVGQSFELY